MFLHFDFFMFDRSSLDQQFFYAFFKGIKLPFAKSKISFSPCGSQLFKKWRRYLFSQEVFS